MLNKMSRREKILLVITLLTALSYVFIQYAFWPTLSKYQQTRKEISQLQQNIRQADVISKTKTKEEDNLKQAQQNLDQLISKFSTNMQDGLFLVKFSRKLGQEQVLLNKFKPLDIEDRQTILVLPVQVEMIGKYPQVTNMLDFLENQANLTEIWHLLAEGPKPEEESAASVILKANGVVKATCLLLIYSQPTPQGRLVLEDIKNWHFGKLNPFESKEQPVLNELGRVPYSANPVPLNPSKSNDTGNNSQWLPTVPLEQDSSNWLPQSSAYTEKPDKNRI